MAAPDVGRHMSCASATTALDPNLDLLLPCAQKSAMRTVVKNAYTLGLLKPSLYSAVYRRLAMGVKDGHG